MHTIHKQVILLDKKYWEQYGWFKAGVSAVGMGSKSISNQLLKEKNYAKIEELTKEAMSIVKAMK